MLSSARDMAGFLAANLGELPIDPRLQAAMLLAQRCLGNDGVRS
jgi:hypothetical protein